MPELRRPARPAVGWCFLAIAFLGFASCAPQRPGSLEVCTSCVPPEIREKVTVGVHLGQSYGTAVAYHFNGTAITLSSRPGSDEYRALVGRVVNLKPVPEPTLWQRFSSSVSRFLKTVARAIGFTMLDEHVFAEVLGKLKADVDQKLDSEIYKVTVTAPFLPARYPEGGIRYVLDDVFLREGLARPLYMSEAQAALAATGRLSCPPFKLDSELFEETRDPNPPDEGVFFISLTKDSVHTSFARSVCFYRPHWERDGVINSRYGLARLSDHPTSEAFWADLQSYLVEQVTKDGTHYHWMSRGIGIVLVGGEAAREAEFLRVVRHVTDTMNEAHESQTAPAEMVVPQDPGRIAAVGAAMLSRLVVDGKYYCKTEECLGPDADLPSDADEKMEL